MFSSNKKNTPPVSMTSWEEHAFRFEQKLVHSDTYKDHFEKLLVSIKELTKNSTKCHVAYDSSEKNDDEHWVNNFVTQFCKDLQTAGFGITSSNDINEIKKNNRFLLLGTKSLNMKCDNLLESVRICGSALREKYKRLNPIIPIVLSGTIESSLPDYCGNLRALYFKRLGYLESLRELIECLFGIKDNKSYDTLWEDFYSNHKKLILNEDDVKKLLKDEQQCTTITTSETKEVKAQQIQNNDKSSIANLIVAARTSFLTDSSENKKNNEGQSKYKETVIEKHFKEYINNHKIDSSDLTPIIIKLKDLADPSDQIDFLIDNYHGLKSNASKSVIANFFQDDKSFFKENFSCEIKIDKDNQLTRTALGLQNKL